MTLSARGLTAGELAERSFRPLDPLCPVLFVDSTAGVGPRRAGPEHPVLRRHGRHREGGILGIRGGDGAEGARFWLQVFSELKSRGVGDVFFADFDGLKGRPEATTTTRDRAVVQQCVVHLIRDSFRCAGRQRRDGIVAALKPDPAHHSSDSPLELRVVFRDGLPRGQQQRAEQDGFSDRAGRVWPAGEEPVGAEAVRGSASGAYAGALEITRDR